MSIKRKHRQSGFTFLEIVISVAILVIIATVAFIGLASFNKGQALETGTRDIAAMLREAEGNARGRINSANWGVRVWNSAAASPCGTTNACAELFYGSSYASANVTRRVTLSSNADLTDPAEGQYSDIIFQTGSSALASTTAPWMTYVGTDDGICNNTNSIECRLYVAQHVGVGGNCGGSTAWNCAAIDTATSGITGRRANAALDPSGHVWVVYRDVATTALKLARYAPGSAASGSCAADWTCYVIDDSGDRGDYATIDFDRLGNAWIVYYDLTATSLKVARYLASSGSDVNCVGNTDTASWGCYVIDDGTYVPDGDHISATFDLSGNAWITYRVNDADSILKVAHTISASADSGCTGNTDSLIWECKVLDNPAATSAGFYSSIAINPATNVPWVRYVDGGNNLKVATYVKSGGTGCGGGATDWTCETITASVQGGTSSFGGGTIAFNPTNNTAWISYLFDNGTTRGLSFARYVATGGTGCSASTKWTCKQIDGGASGTLGQESALDFDNSGGAWMSYRYTPAAGTPALKAAQYVGSGGTGCSNSTDLNTWNCWTVDNRSAGTSGVGNVTSTVALAGDRVVVYSVSQSALKHVITVNTFGSVTIE